MAANSGKLSESQFIKSVESHPRSLVFRYRDASDLYGLNKKKVAIFPLPSDFIIVRDGRTIFAEVKSTQNKTSFSLDMLEAGQKAALVKVTACGGDYHIYIHNLNTNTWYLMTGAEYLQHRKSGSKSVKWENINEYLD